MNIRQYHSLVLPFFVATMSACGGGSSGGSSAAGPFDGVYSIQGSTDLTAGTPNDCGNITGTMTISDSNVTGTVANDLRGVNYTLSGYVYDDGSLRGEISINSTSEGLFDGNMTEFAVSEGYWNDSVDCVRGAWTALRQ